MYVGRIWNGSECALSFEVDGVSTMYFAVQIKAEQQFLSDTHLAIHNGTTDCEVFSRGIQN